MSDVVTPALRAALTRKSNGRGAWEVAKDWGLVLAGFSLAMVWAHPLSYLLAVLLLSAAMAGFAILQHEAAHRSLFASQRVNDWVGEYLAALPILQSMPGYRAYHMRHHRLAGTADDPDLIMTEHYPVSRSSLRRKLLRDITGWTGLKSLFGMLMMFAGYYQYELTGRAVRKQPAPRGLAGYLRHFVAMNGHVAILWQLVLWGALHALGHGMLYLLWVAAYLLVFPVCMRVRQIADHAVVADAMSTDPLQHARTSRARWYERLLFAPHYEHYHLEHHLLPTAPCWQLPRLHEELVKRALIPPANQADSLVGVLRRAVR